MGWQLNAIQAVFWGFFHIPMDKDCKQGGKRERGCVDVTSQSGFLFERELQQRLQGVEKPPVESV